MRNEFLNELLTKLIKQKQYDKQTIENKLDVFYAMNKITDEEYSTLTLLAEETYVVEEKIQNDEEGVE